MGSLRTAEDRESQKKANTVLVNDVIANALFKGGRTEGCGRGILDIFTLCKEAGLPETEYDFVPDFVCLTIRFNSPLTPYLSNHSGGSPSERLNERLAPDLLAALALIKAPPGIQRKEIVAKTGKGDATIGRYIVTLTEKCLIEHRGAKKTGGYYAK